MTAYNSEPSPATKLPVFAVRATRRLWRLVFDSSYRNLTRLRLPPPRGAFQPFNDTRADRYPKILGSVQSTLGAASKIRILSYGCSTGEEVFSLRTYLPCAVIKGIDINAPKVTVHPMVHTPTIRKAGGCQECAVDSFARTKGAGAVTQKGRE
jgi:hypothetical protein